MFQDLLNALLSFIDYLLSSFINLLIYLISWLPNSQTSVNYNITGVGLSDYFQAADYIFPCHEAVELITFVSAFLIGRLLYTVIRTM